MNKISASFRDPAGFMYRNDNSLLRQVNQSASEDYDTFMDSLYPVLVERNLLIPHEEVSLDLAYSSEAYKVLQPQRIPFISYPYEWAFEQLKDAALLTLRIQKIAMKLGFILKDASAYNIQFIGAKPIFIDTLSFARYEQGQAWDAYGQFCQQFLAPLALAAYQDIELMRLLRTYVDGIPLKVASSLLPWTSRFRPGIQIHIHTHARLQTRAQNNAKQGDNSKQAHVDKKTVQNIVSDLQALINSLKWSSDTPWSDYYDGDSYVQIAFEHKKTLVSEYIDAIKPKMVWDMGANTGSFSQLTGDAITIAWDFDTGAVQEHYRQLKSKSESNILPLMQDLMNPSPNIGWMNSERDGLLKRFEQVDMVMALALIHHIVITNNVPLSDFAKFLQRIAPVAIVEFVPKTDPKVQFMLQNRKDIFPDYTREGFENAFSDCFEILRSDEIPNSQRILYLLKEKSTINN